MDLKSGFSHWPLAEEDRKRVCFYGAERDVYMWMTMPFDLIGAPAAFARWIQAVIERKILEGTHVYVDDILLEGKTVDEVIDRLSKIFTKTADVRQPFQVCHGHPCQVPGRDQTSRRVYALSRKG